MMASLCPLKAGCGGRETLELAFWLQAAGLVRLRVYSRVRAAFQPILELGGPALEEAVAEEGAVVAAARVEFSGRRKSSSKPPRSPPVQASAIELREAGGYGGLEFESPESAAR